MFCLLFNYFIHCFHRHQEKIDCFVIEWNFLQVQSLAMNRAQQQLINNQDSLNIIIHLIFLIWDHLIKVYLNKNENYIPTYGHFNNSWSNYKSNLIKQTKEWNNNILTLIKIKISNHILIDYGQNSIKLARILIK